MREQERAEGMVGAQTITNQGCYLSAGLPYQFRAFGWLRLRLRLRVAKAHEHYHHPSSALRRRVRMGLMKHRHTISH